MGTSAPCDTKPMARYTGGIRINHVRAYQAGCSLRRQYGHFAYKALHSTELHIEHCKIRKLFRVSICLGFICNVSLLCRALYAMRYTEREGTHRGYGLVQHKQAWRRSFLACVHCALNTFQPWQRSWCRLAVPFRRRYQPVLGYVLG